MRRKAAWCGVSVDWQPLLDRDASGERPVQLELQVDDERARPDAHDVTTFVALFFCDAYLLLNLAVPGSFGAAIVTLSGEQHRARS